MSLFPGGAEKVLSHPLLYVTVGITFPHEMTVGPGPRLRLIAMTAILTLSIDPA